MPFLIPANETQLEYIKKQPFYRSAIELEDDVTQLIEWLSKQPHLPNITDRKWLLHFIMGCKFSLQRSKQVIEMYFMARAELPELFGSLTREELEEVGKFGNIASFPKLTPEGNRVCCTRTLPITDDDIFNTPLHKKRAIAMLDLLLREEPLYSNIFLFDMEHFRLSQFLTFTPTIARNFMRCFLHSFPLRVKSVHFLNPPKFMGRLLTFIKMFLPNKIKERVFVHFYIEELHQYVPKDVLPDIYGGTGGNIEKFENYAYDLMLSNKEWLGERPKADLSKLPTHLKSNELDMHGTFKQLHID